MSNDTISHDVTNSITDRLAAYISSALEVPVPEAVSVKARHHILDTLAAMLSGAELLPGKRALTYATRLGGPAEAAIVASGAHSSYLTAAFVNGLLAHADETDDSHAPSLTHPGCSIVPAALTTADWQGSSGEELVRAVVLGYDICTRINLAITVSVLEETQRSTYSISGAFGAMAVAAALVRLSANQVRYALSYTGQQASGLASWRRDLEHVEKAFVFAGMPVRAGTSAVDMVMNGFTGVSDVFDGVTNFMGAFSPQGEPDELTAGLGSRYEILRTNIKRWPVGSPIQAAVDSLTALMADNDLSPERIKRLTVHLPTGGAETVDDRHMPDINLQHIMAVTLLDKGLVFTASQDYGRMTARDVVDLKKRITLIPDPELDDTDPPRQGIVVVELMDGTVLRHHTRAVRGTLDNPMPEAEVVKKTNDLLHPLLGEARTAELVSAILELPSVNNVRDLRGMLKF